MSDEQSHEAEAEAEDDLVVEHSGFEQVPALLYRDVEVSDGAVRMYCILSDRGATGSNSVPKRAKLAKLIGKSLRTVDGRIDELEARGWLLVTPRFRDDEPGMTTNLYRLLKTPIRSEDDPRLLRHKRAVAVFEEEMEARIETNRRRKLGQDPTNSADPSQDSAPPLPPAETPGPLAENCEGPLAESCEGGAQNPAGDPSQKTAPQEPDLCFDQTFGVYPTPAAVAATSEDAPASGALFDPPPDEPTPPAPAATFEDFYGRYPNRKAPGDAAKAWRQVTKAGATPAEIMTGVDAYLAYLEKNPDKRAFMKYPATWLRAKCWLDEYPDVPAPAARRDEVARRSMVKGWMEQAERIDAAVEQRRSSMGGAW